MSSRMRRPETVKIDISRGDWLLVKKHLTAGETRAIFRRMMREGVTHDRIDTLRTGWSKMVGYLLDWSITDADDKPVVIRDQSEETIGAALDALDMDAFVEILKAIETHEQAMERSEKNDQATGSKSSETSPSPSGVDGGTNGSPNSRMMSIAF